MGPFTMTNEGKVVGWRDLEEIRDGGVVEIGLRIEGRRKEEEGDEERKSTGGIW